MTPVSNTPTDQRAEETEQVENHHENNSISSHPATEEISKGEKRSDDRVSEMEFGEAGDEGVRDADKEGRRGEYITGMRFYLMVLS